MRRVTFIQASNILAFLHDIWSEIVEVSIVKYEDDDIYSLKYVEIVAERANMKTDIPWRSCSLGVFWQQQACIVYSMVDRCLGIYGKYLDHDILSLLSQVQRSALIQFGMKSEFITQLSEKFPLQWNLLENDFALFKELDALLEEQIQEFPNLQEKEKFDPASLRKPSFKGSCGGRILF